MADSVSRRYHWQHEHLLGVDDSRFGSVRWELDAREQLQKWKNLAYQIFLFQGQERVSLDSKLWGVNRW